MIFDVTNELLDGFRRGKQDGVKLPPKLLWMDAATLTPDKLPQVFASISAAVTEHAAAMCGFIETKDSSLMQLPFLMDDDILGQIKEDRMNRMLNNEIRVFEKRLLVSDDELYEVGLELSNLVFEYLVEDVVSLYSTRDD